MMKYGLSEQQLSTIQEIFSQTPEIDEVVLFGSRAMGNYKEASDIDLAIKGKKADTFLAAKLKSYFEDETNLLFFFDVIAYKAITSEKLKQHIDGKGVVIYQKGGTSNWRKYSLDDLFVNYDHKRKPLSKIERSEKQGVYPYYGASGIIDHLDDYLFDGEYLLISEDGENLKTRQTPIAFVVSGKFWVNNHAHIMKANHPFHSQLIAYYISDLDIHEFITGAVQPKLNQKNLKNIPIFLPENIGEQRAIAEVLCSLDDKIDLLRRQNKTLEAIAETLFHQWFVVEAKEDWDMGILPDEFNFTMGLSPPGVSYNEDGNGLPMFQGNADFEFRFPRNRVYTTEPKRIANVFDTLVSVRAPVGEQNMSFETCCIGRGVASFRYKHDDNFYTYTYFKMKALMSKMQIFNNTGTVFDSIGKADIEQLEMLIPKIEAVKRYQNIAKPLDDKIILNCKKIQTLATLCDTLLPKLISGKVRVDYDKE
ncbi:MAG: restriction endonuclease subunit S [Gammaproteobacteria bacterium]|nr:restriction endonuclease subunit S [Gammaproteobacteria bacterium]